jgi:Mrp family chromosome partitioning ATPase
MEEKKQKCDVDKPCDSCESGGTCSAKEKEEHEQRRLEERLFHIRHKIMVMSGKGGVGKSTVAINLGAALALRDYQVGILDADIHGPNVPRMLGVDKESLIGVEGGVNPVEVFKGFKAVSMGLLAHDPDRAIVWRGPLKHSAIKQFLGDVNWGDLDFLFVDLPPGTGDEPLSVAHLIKNVSGSIIVTTPQEVALLDSRKAVNFSRLLKVPVLGIVENMSGMVCPHCGGQIDLFKVGGGEKAATDLGVPFLGRIPIDPRVVENCDSGQPFMKDSAESEVKQAFSEIIEKVLQTLGTPREKLAHGMH